MATSNDKSTQLAKVLWYYNLIPDTHSSTYKIVCPFHGDVNPSLLVNMEEGNWFCFGCNLTGDAEKFVRLLERKLHGLNDLQACKKFREILRSDKCSDIHIDVQQIAKGKKPQKQLYNEAYDYYHGLRMPDWEHDLDDEVEEAAQYMMQRGFSPVTLNKCKAKVNYNAFYPIIFPIMDNGKFRGWVCRTMRKDVEQRRKYLYNEGFSRATTVVGNYGTKDYVIVVEGYMDRLKFVQNGVDNVVALFGWKMSKQQYDKLTAAGVTKVISALDNDKCGRKGTQYLKSVFGPENVLRFSYLKGIKDPGEMTPEAFKKMYDKTMAAYKAKYQVKKRSKL